MAATSVLMSMIIMMTIIRILMTKSDVDNDVDNDDYDDYDDDNYQVSCGFQDAGQPAGPSGVCLVQGISSIIITTIIIIHTKINLT